MTRGFLVIIAVFALLSACTQRLICPAYQSAFIYDKEALRQKFSYFKEDSTPKVLTANKNKYLLAVPESYRKTNRKMQTVEMKPVYPRKPDALQKADGDMLLAELDSASADSVGRSKETEPGDSTYAITKTKEKYNLDQDLYMWYFREVLVLPDVRAAIENKDRKPSDKVGADGKKEKVGFLQGIKNLFKKKPKADSTAVKDPTGKTTTEPKEKSGLFKKKKKKTDPPKEKDPAKKEGDGF